MPLDVPGCFRSGCELLAKFSPLAAAFAEEIQAGAAGMPMALNGDFFNNRGAGQESALYADAVAGYPADSKTFTVARSMNTNHGPFELLDAFVVAFFNANENSDSIPGSQLGDVGVLGRL